MQLDTLIILGLAVLLEKIIPSSYYVKFDFKQRFINYTTLAVTAVIVWVTMSYLASLLVFGPENKDVAIKLLPLTAFIGVLLYVVDIQFIHYRICKYKSNKDKEVQLEDNETDKKMIDFGGKNSKVNDYEHVTLERIALKTGQKIHVVLVPDIVYIKSDGDYVHIYTDNCMKNNLKYFF